MLYLFVTSIFPNINFKQREAPQTKLEATLFNFYQQMGEYVKKLILKRKKKEKKRKKQKLKQQNNVKVLGAAAISNEYVNNWQR